MLGLGGFAAIDVVTSLVRPSTTAAMLYIWGYVGLVFVWGLLLLCVGVRLQLRDASTSLLVCSVHLRLRWVFLALVFNLAGLPPFFFFGCKLGLLSLVLTTASSAVVGVLFVYIFFGWVIYFQLARQLLGAREGVLVGPVSTRRLPPSCALACVCFLFVCLAGLLLFEDACLWVALGVA